MKFKITSTSGRQYPVNEIEINTLDDLETFFWNDADAESLIIHFVEEPPFIHEIEIYDAYRE